MAVIRMMVFFVLLLGAMTVLVSADQAPAPPIIQDPGTEDTLYKLEDATVEVVCRATGHPTPTYQWHFHKDYAPYDNPNTVVSADNPPGGRVTFNNASGLLTITGLTNEESGFYYCRASTAGTRINNFNGASAMSPSVEVRLSYLDDWPENIKTEIRRVTKNVGEYGFIKCDDPLPPHSGEISINWYRRNVDANVLVDSDTRIFTDQTGVLWFTSMVAEDARLPYTCGVVSSKTGNRVMGSVVNVAVLPGDGEDVATQLRYHTGDNKTRPEDLTFLRGEELRLECFFSGHPPPMITWRDRKGAVIRGGGHYTLKDNNRVLAIKQAAEEDEGMFTCEGTNSGGTRSGSLDVNITSPPYWEDDFKTEVMVAEGSDAVLSCKARSMLNENPPEPPVWYRNGKPMGQTYDREKYEFSEGMRVMRVRNASKTVDIACYQCFVSNSVGQLFGQTCVNVYTPITIVYRPPERQAVNKGEIVNLTVVAVSDQYLTLFYEWVYDNVTYKLEEAPPHVTYDALTHRAYINTSRLTDEQFKEINGTYVRNVYHQYQSRTVNVTVTQRYDVAVAAFPYWIIGLVLALLILLLVIILCCCVCCRRKMQEGDYPVDKKETAAGLDPEREAKEGFPDLSRADDPYQKKKPNPLDMDGQSVMDDESFSTEYGEEPTAFNEDGSFIGAYKAKDKQKDRQPVLSPGHQNAMHPRDNPAYQSGNESSV